MSIKTANYGDFKQPSPYAPDFAERMADIAKYDLIVAPAHWLAGIGGYHPSNPHLLEDALALVRSSSPSAKILRYYNSQNKVAWDADWEIQGPVGLQLKWTQNFLLWRDIVSHDWGLRDSAGEIVKEDSRIWLVDIGKPGVKEAALEGLIRSWVGGFNGVMMDVLDVPRRYMAAGRGYAEYADDRDWWERAWKPYVEYLWPGVRAALGIEVWGNFAGFYGMERYSFPKDSHQRQFLDGVNHESCFFGWEGQWLGELEARMASVQSDPLAIITNDITGEADCTVAAHLLTLPGNRRLREKRYTHYCTDRTAFWNSGWEVDLGAPLGVKESPKPLVYRRYFERGVVVLNYSTLPYQATFQIAHRGRVTIPAHSSFILRR